MQTKFNHLTNAELLVAMGEKRIQSVIIDELCQRLESPEWVLNNTNPIVACPVCDARLKITHVVDGDLFNVKVAE